MMGRDVLQSSQSREEMLPKIYTCVGKLQRVKLVVRLRTIAGRKGGFAPCMLHRYSSTDARRYLIVCVLLQTLLKSFGSVP